MKCTSQIPNKSYHFVSEISCFKMVLKVEISLDNESKLIPKSSCTVMMDLCNSGLNI